jgi:hypothetical protein
LPEVVVKRKRENKETMDENAWKRGNAQDERKKESIESEENVRVKYINWGVVKERTG